jgi:hypothetical protein
MLPEDVALRAGFKLNCLEKYDWQLPELRELAENATGVDSHARALERSIKISLESAGSPDVMKFRP